MFPHVGEYLPLNKSLDPINASLLSVDVTAEIFFTLHAVNIFLIFVFVFIRYDTPGAHLNCDQFAIVRAFYLGQKGLVSLNFPIFSCHYVFHSIPGDGKFYQDDSMFWKGIIHKDKIWFFVLEAVDVGDRSSMDAEAIKVSVNFEFVTRRFF